MCKRIRMPRDFPHCFHRLLGVRVTDRETPEVPSAICNGFLEGEGLLLTGRHGSFSSYEVFIHVIDRQLVEVRIKSW